MDSLVPICPALPGFWLCQPPFATSQAVQVCQSVSLRSLCSSAFIHSRLHRVTTRQVGATSCGKKPFAWFAFFAVKSLRSLCSLRLNGKASNHPGYLTQPIQVGLWLRSFGLGQSRNPVAAIFLVGGEDFYAEDLRQGLFGFLLDGVQRGLPGFRGQVCVGPHLVRRSLRGLLHAEALGGHAVGQPVTLRHVVQ